MAGSVRPPRDRRPGFLIAVLLDERREPLLAMGQSQLADSRIARRPNTNVPTATNFKKAPAIASGQAKLRHRVFGQFPNQVLIQAAVRGADRQFHKRIDLSRPNLKLGQLCVIYFSHGQSARSLNMRLLGFRDQQDRNALNDPVAVANGTAEPIRFLTKILLISRTNQKFQKVFVNRLHVNRLHKEAITNERR